MFVDESIFPVVQRHWREAFHLVSGNADKGKGKGKGKADDDNNPDIHDKNRPKGGKKGKDEKGAGRWISDAAKGWQGKGGGKTDREFKTKEHGYPFKLKLAIVTELSNPEERVNQIGLGDGNDNNVQKSSTAT